MSRGSPPPRLSRLGGGRMPGHRVGVGKSSHHSVERGRGCYAGKRGPFQCRRGSHDGRGGRSVGGWFYGDRRGDLGGEVRRRGVAGR
jgi:hypothetical protein